MSFVKAIGDGVGEEYEALIFTDKQMAISDINGRIVYLGNSGLNASVDNVSHKFVLIILIYFFKYILLNPIFIF